MPKTSKQITFNYVSHKSVVERNNRCYYLVKCPVAIDEDRLNFRFGWLKAMIHHGKTYEVFSMHKEEAIRFTSLKEAREAGRAMLGKSFSQSLNIQKVEGA